MFSAALGQASRQVHEFDLSLCSSPIGILMAKAFPFVLRSVIQPGIQKATDPNLRTQFKGYVDQAAVLASEAARRGGQVLEGGGQFAKSHGYDVGDLVRLISTIAVKVD
jgi:hypothetical protein